MRVNTQALVNTNLETEKNIHGTVLPVIERLHKEIKNKSKELASGAQKGAKDVEKARNTTQKQIELLGQHTAAFESAGAKSHSHDDPYIIRRGVIHRLNKQVMEENNHRNDLIAVQTNFQVFEAHVIRVIQEAMEAFNTFAGGQAEKVRALYSDMLGAAQRIPSDFEWNAFLARSKDVLINPNEDPRSVSSIQFANMNHASTKALIEGSLERKSRNKLSWGTHTGYYVVTPSKFLHEFKDDDDLRADPKPELSIYLPDAVVGAPNGEKFSVKGKDRSGNMGGKLAGTSELSFKAHSPAEAQKWFEIIRGVQGATGPAPVTSPTPSPPAVLQDDKKLEAAAAPAAAAAAAAPEKPTVVTQHQGQEAGKHFILGTGGVERETGTDITPGVTGAATTASPVAVSPTSPTATTTAPSSAVDTKAPVGSIDTAVVSPTTPASAVPTSAKDEKAPLSN